MLLLCHHNKAHVKLPEDLEATCWAIEKLEMENNDLSNQLKEKENE